MLWMSTCCLPYLFLQFLLIAHTRTDTHKHDTTTTKTKTTKNRWEQTKIKEYKKGTSFSHSTHTEDAPKIMKKDRLKHYYIHRITWLSLVKMHSSATTKRDREAGWVEIFDVICARFFDNQKMLACVCVHLLKSVSRNCYRKKKNKSDSKREFFRRFFLLWFQKKNWKSIGKWIEKFKHNIDK